MGYVVLISQAFHNLFGKENLFSCVPACYRPVPRSCEEEDKTPNFILIACQQKFMRPQRLDFGKVTSWVWSSEQRILSWLDIIILHRFDLSYRKGSVVNPVSLVYYSLTKAHRPVPFMLPPVDYLNPQYHYHMWPYLDMGALTTLVRALVISRLDYCNTLYVGCLLYTSPSPRD